jgi:hypothetical protein
MKEEIIYPASYKIAVDKHSFIDTELISKVQKCEVNIQNNVRYINSHLHWKPISKIIGS